MNKLWSIVQYVLFAAAGLLIGYGQAGFGGVLILIGAVIALVNTTFRGSS